MPIRQRLQIAAAWAWRVHPEHAGGDSVVGAAVGDGGFDGYEGEVFDGDALAVPLAEIEGRCLHASNKDGEAGVFDDGAAAHVEDVSAHACEVAVFVFEFKAAVIQRDEFDFEFERAGVQAAAFAAEFDRSSARFEFADRLRIADANGGVFDSVADECAQEACSISRRAPRAQSGSRAVV